SGRKPIFGALELDELKRMVIQDTKHRRLSAQEIKDLWNKEKNQSVSIVTIHHALKKAELRPIVPIYGKINSEVYIKLIRRHTLHAVCRLVPNSQGIFQQDNATPHKYWKVKAAFSQAGIPILPWPAQSPDLNPIENMWQEVER
ncbi:16430_t:CDS:2, partial [Cetraspora pellucida]